MSEESKVLNSLESKSESDTSTDQSATLPFLLKLSSIVVSAIVLLVANVLGVLLLFVAAAIQLSAGGVCFYDILWLVVMVAGFASIAFGWFLFLHIPKLSRDHDSLAKLFKIISIIISIFLTIIGALFGVLQFVIK